MAGGYANKRKGTRMEHDIKHALEMMLFYVIRAYSSKGVADLVASPPYNKLAKTKSLLIQCKNSTTKKDYVVPFERDHLNYLAQTNAGKVLLIYKDNGYTMVKDWKTGKKQTFDTFIQTEYGIKCNIKELLKHFSNQERPINLYPLHKDEKERPVAPFTDFYDVKCYFPHVAEKFKDSDKKDERHALI